MHTSLMGLLGLGLSGLWGRLEGDGGGDCSFGDGDLASEVGPIPENKNKTNKAIKVLNTLRTGDADLRFYITTVQDG